MTDGNWIKEKDLKIKEYERRILEEGLCSKFLPMSSIEKNGEGWICFDEGNAVPFTNYGENKGKLMNASSGLAFLRSVVEGLRDGENHLLSLSQVPLTAEKIYISPISGEAKLVYNIWGEEAENSNGGEKSEEKQTLNSRLRSFITEMEDLLRDPEWQSYGERLKKDIEETNPDLRELVRRLGEMEREAERLRWPLPSVPREGFWEEEETEAEEKGIDFMKRVFQSITDFFK